MTFICGFTHAAILCRSGSCRGDHEGWASRLAGGQEVILSQKPFTPSRNVADLGECLRPSSPTKVAPNLVLPIINAGIRGVLNFTSTPLNFPQGIVVENYDITTLLEKVAYFVKENEESNSSNA
jgi:hypothetical protein